MLTEIRERSSGVVAWFVAALIIIPMAFFGLNQYASNTPEPIVVTFGEQKITEREYKNALSRQQQYMRQIMGENVDNNLLNSPSFKQNVLQDLINNKVVVGAAEENNYRIGDTQLSKLIKQSDVFKKDGKFDAEAYSKYVSSQQYSKTQFETKLRDQSRLAQVGSGYQESAFVLPSELNTLVALRSEKRNFDLTSIDLDSVIETVQVSDEKTASYYEANKSSFYKPEQISIEYLQIKLDDILPEVSVDEDELKAIFERDAENYGAEEKRSVRHILFEIEKGISNEEVEKIRQKALGLINELDKGADFSELAKKHSEDKNSAKKGGSLGKIQRGQMLKAFENAAYTLSKGEISKPIRTPQGYHIILVDEIEQTKINFSDVRDEIEKQEKANLAENLLLERVEQLADLSYEHPESLEVAAEELNLTIQKSELFTEKQGEGIARFPVVREAAFGEDVLIENLNSERIELSPTEYVVLRKLEHKESAPKPLEEVKQDIVALLKNSEARRLVREKGAKLLTEIQTGNWSDVLEREKLKATSYTVSLANKTGVINAAVLDRIFTLSMEDGKPVVDGLQDAAGRYYLMNMTNIEQSDTSQVEAKVKQDAIDIISRRTGKDYLDSYLSGLTNDLDPVINQDLL